MISKTTANKKNQTVMISFGEISKKKATIYHYGLAARKSIWYTLDLTGNFRCFYRAAMAELVDALA